MKYSIGFIILLITMILLSTACRQPANVLREHEQYLLVGTYTQEESKGIYVYAFDTLSATVRLISTTPVSNPSYLTPAVNGNYVYAVSEDAENAQAHAYQFDRVTGTLSLLNSKPTGGAAPCYITVDKAQQRVITANYTGGSISSFPLDTNGKLMDATVISFIGHGTDPVRQTHTHLHSVHYSPDEKYLYAMDLGTDKIYCFKTQPTQDFYLVQSVPGEIDLPPVSGPRHMDFHPNGRFAYLISELSGMVNVYGYDAKDGRLTALQAVAADTIPAGGSADIHVSPDGRFLYASNRLQNDGLAIFRIDSSGLLSRIGYQRTGTHPRNFTLTPDGRFLLVACRDSNVIQVFRVDTETGLLTDIKQDIPLSMPVCLKFVP
ncbi:MAG: lactonase family protein [Prevotellaceae bacterium]|jgi:6-phosphogluconolactonase (cycloisomerase 2 family)|nr:lactonase family protein [Prevotellaceae bacterium]